MTFLRTTCPRCGEDVLLKEWMEWHPYGSTYAGEPMIDVVDAPCCEWSEEDWELMIDQAEPEVEMEAEFWAQEASERHSESLGPFPAGEGKGKDPPALSEP